MTRKLFIGAALALGACAGKVETTPVALTPAHEQAVRSGIASRLKDPESAKFGPTMVASRSKETGTIRVCGTVNAKNGFGGYGGETRFVADIVDVGGTPTFKDGTVGTPGDPFAVNVLCQVAGL